jgi:hypothetical protein
MTTQALVNYTPLNRVFLSFFSCGMLLSSPWPPLIFRCKWSCKPDWLIQQWSDLYPAKFLFWFTDTINLCARRWCFVSLPKISVLYWCWCFLHLQMQKQPETELRPRILPRSRIPVTMSSRRRCTFPTDIFSLTRGTLQLTSIAAYSVEIFRKQPGRLQIISLPCLCSINKNYILSSSVRWACLFFFFLCFFLGVEYDLLLFIIM